MIVRKNILKNLKIINREYKQVSKNPVHIELLAKLAILELCGWIEKSVDGIILSYAKHHVKISDNIKYLEEVVKNTHNLGYNNFRRLMTVLIGIPNLEYIEKKIEIKILQDFKVTMETLKKYRDELSHTHTSIIQKQLDAPSVTIQNFEKVYKGFKSFEKILRTLKPVNRP